MGIPTPRTHSYGWEAEKAVETARAQVARLIRAADPKEVIFTSGATESNNLAIKGVARFARKADPRRNHIITTATEHKCVLDSMRWLGEEEGFEVTYLPVGSDGLVCVEDLKAALRPESTCLVSIMAVNNEIGVVQPMASLGAAIKASNPAIYFHTDAAQAVGKLPELDVNAWHVDCMSVSGHKLYGPKGIGALYVRRRPRVRLEPLISGGGQERGLRSGTVPAPLAVGLGAACDIASQEVLRDHQHISKLSRRLVDGILQHIPSVTRNGSTHHYYPGCVNLSFACVEGEVTVDVLESDGVVFWVSMYVCFPRTIVRVASPRGRRRHGSFEHQVWPGQVYHGKRGGLLYCRNSAACQTTPRLVTFVGNGPRGHRLEVHPVEPALRLNK